jgi:hypothetical protein
MSTFSFVNPATGKRFEIEGPPALTEAQARRIFEDQLNAGALVGLKPGDVLDSARQALDGVAGAAGQLAQQAQNIAGSAAGALTGALDKVSGGVQGALQSAAGQLQGAVQQAAAGLAGGLQGAVSSLGQQATQFASALPSAISSATNAVQSVASRALSAIPASISNLVPTNPINMGDLAKQATALLPVQGLPQLDVRAAMAQATKLADQASDILSDLGVGKFAFDAKQLEITGIVKPGMANLVGAVNTITGGVNSLTSVLSSPAAFTGKLGINKVEDLLGSVSKQNLLQQDLMNKGLNGVAELGIPLNKLNPGALAGTALNAAKSVTDTFKWATGGNLPTALKDRFNRVARAADFASNFANQATNDAVTQQAEPGAAEDTANRDTVDAAVTRVTGNAKIPPINYGSYPIIFQAGQLREELSGDITALIKEWTTFYGSLQEFAKTGAKENRDSEKPDVPKLLGDYKIVEQFLADIRAFQSRTLALVRRVKAYEDKYPGYGVGPGRVQVEYRLLPFLVKAVTQVEESVDKYKTRIESLTA